MADRRYDDKEVGEILKTAAEMQSSLARSGTAEGMTLDELQTVAKEIGIDPDNIGRAAAELETSPKLKSRGKPDSILIERTIAGELTDDVWDELVTELRQFSGKPGATETRGKSREWTAGTDTESFMLSAVSRKGGTRLKLFGNTSGMTALIGSIALTFGILATTIPVAIAKRNHFVIDPLLTASLVILVAGAWFVAAMVTVGANRKRFGSRIQTLLADLAEIAEAGLDPSPAVDPVFSDLTSRLGNAVSGEPNSTDTPTAKQVRYRP